MEICLLHDITQLAVPWRHIVTSMPCMSIFVGDFCAAWGGYAISTSGAQYMRDVLKFDIKAVSEDISH